MAFAESLVGLLDSSAQSARGRIKRWSSRPEGKSDFSYKDISEASSKLSLFLQQQGIKEAVVFSREFNGKEELYAVLLLAESQVDPKASVQDANRRLSPHQRVQGWTVWQREDFPRTHTLKAKRDVIIKETMK